MDPTTTFFRIGANRWINLAEVVAVEPSGLGGRLLVVLHNGRNVVVEDPDVAARLVAALEGLAG
jgi:hypothetical protein